MIYILKDRRVMSVKELAYDVEFRVPAESIEDATDKFISYFRKKYRIRNIDIIARREITANAVYAIKIRLLDNNIYKVLSYLTTASN